MRDQFLDGAEVVLKAVSDPRVAQAWDSPSVLAEQSIGSLSGHLARGSVWVADDYLNEPVPTTEPVFDTAAHYFASVTDALTDADHEAIRDRGTEVASAGHDAVVDQLKKAILKLRARLPHEPEDRTLPVIGGAVIRLDDYLWTRIVEQVVHLDDLAQSLGIEPWENPPDAEALVIGCGAEIGRRRHGGAAMVRTLYRSGVPGTLPVL